MPGVLIVVVVLVVAIVVYLANQQAQRTDATWSLAAQKLGLEFVGGGLFKSRRMTGRVGACRVAVDVYTRGSGNSRTTYTRFRVHFPRRLVPGLKLTRQGFLSGVASFFGAQDIEVGDRAFDDEVVVKGASEQQVVAFLTPARRVRIQRLMHGYSGAVVHSDRIEWLKLGVIREVKPLLSTVRSLVATATALAAPEAVDEPLERALAARAEGDLAGAREHLAKARRKRARLATPQPPPAPSDAAALSPPPSSAPAEPSEPPSEPVPEGIDETLMEGELLYLEGRREEAKQVFEEARAALPDDPGVEAWAAGAEEPETPAPEGEGPPSLDVESVCRTLFAEVSSSLEANRIFEARYQDLEVAWEGTLLSAQSFSFDFVLGNEGGTKALVDVYELSEVSIGGNRVTAVVGLPKGEDDPLVAYAGKTIRVRGRLVRVDSFMRNVFLKDGSWEAV